MHLPAFSLPFTLHAFRWEPLFKRSHFPFRFPKVKKESIRENVCHFNKSWLFSPLELYLDFKYRSFSLLTSISKFSKMAAPRYVWFLHSFELSCNRKTETSPWNWKGIYLSQRFPEVNQNVSKQVVKCRILKGRTVRAYGSNNCHQRSSKCLSCPCKKKVQQDWTKMQCLPTIFLTLKLFNLLACYKEKQQCILLGFYYAYLYSGKKIMCGFQNVFQRKIWKMWLTFGWILLQDTAC